MGYWNQTKTNSNWTDRSDQNTSVNQSTATHSPATKSATEPSTHQPAVGRQWSSIERAEDHFRMQIPDVETLQRLNHQEQTFGSKAHEWIAEGMPVDIMGKTRQMNAFRQRQAERPPEVPKTIERQNRCSVLRSEKAATETEPAGETGVPEPVRDVLSSRGQSLDPSIQRAMEDRMGDSFGDVRIHTGPSAVDACESINARAFTVGNHIAFNQGEYDPSSPEGQHVLAHELAHVRQQTEGAVSMLPQADMELEVDPDPALEREAEETAQRVMEGGELGIQRLADTKVHVQRAPKAIVQRSIREKLGFGGENNHSEPETDASRAQIDAANGFETFDDGELDETVSTLISNQESLIENQQSLMDAFVTAEPGTAGMDPVADATKGAAGTLASTAAGAAIGSAIPAIGPLGGAVIGAAASDMTKSTVGWMMDYRPGGDAEAMEHKIAELESRLAELEEGSEHGGNSEGLGVSRRD